MMTRSVVIAVTLVGTLSCLASAQDKAPVLDKVLDKPKGPLYPGPARLEEPHPPQARHRPVPHELPAPLAGPPLQPKQQRQLKMLSNR